jgi:hypothetical protein
VDVPDLPIDSDAVVALRVDEAIVAVAVSVTVNVAVVRPGDLPTATARAGGEGFVVSFHVIDYGAEGAKTMCLDARQLEHPADAGWK